MEKSEIITERINAMKKNVETVCIVSPFPPPFGGMSIQAEKSECYLKREGVNVIRVKTNADLPNTLGWVAMIPYFRTFVNMCLFLYNLYNALQKTEVVYFLTAFPNFFFWITYPAIILIKLCGKKVILCAKGGKAESFFRKYGFLLKPVFEKTDVITAPSGFLRDVFINAFGIKPIIIPDITDLDQFHFHKRESFQPKLLVTRALEEIYDIGCVIRAFRIVRDRFPKAQLGIAGGGSRRAELEALVVSLNLTDSVTFYGEVTHKQIHELYRKYDISINASRFDNVPGAILESFASGLPVVSTDAGGIPYMVEDGVTGLLASVGDYEGLALKAIQIITQPELGRRLAEAGAQYCKMYGWDHVRSVLIPLIDSVQFSDRKGNESNDAYGKNKVETELLIA